MPGATLHKQDTGSVLFTFFFFSGLFRVFQSTMRMERLQFVLGAELLRAEGLRPRSGNAAEAKPS